MRLPLQHLATLLLACLFLATDAVASAAGRREVNDLRLVWLEAIDSPDGRSSAALVSPEARAVSQRVQSPSPLLVDVSTLVVYAQPGCRRLRMTIRAENALVGRSTQRRDQDWITEFNYCRDGTPPRTLEVRP